MFARTGATTTVLLGSALLCALGHAQPVGLPLLEQTPILRARSDLVVLHVAVHDGESRFVRGLTAQQFKIYEDGVPQRIQVFSHEDRPATIGLVIDNSGSMRAKRRDVLAASLAFIRASNPQNELFITNFNEAVWLGLPPYMPFTTDPAILEVVLGRTLARGQTALYDGIGTALDHLENGTNSRQVLVVISDGGDNASATSLDSVLRRAQEAHAVIFTVGLFDELSDDRNPGVLKRLAAVTGGERFLPRDLQEASSILERIARDIRNTYDIGYESTNPRRDGKFRQIEVKIDSRGHRRLNVRARTGYIVPADPEVPSAAISPR